MKRVLYFTGYRMVAQEWQGHKLESSVYFEPDEQGLDLFGAYLRSFSNESVRLLVDLIEEEFRQVKIPFLRGSDRQAILKRNYTKYFRNTKFRYAVSQSVEKTTRKEEKLLLIGLTNQSLLEPWLNIIDDTRTPLSGIITLPLLSEDFVGHLETDKSVVILVSQQVPSNLRQSVFVGGKLILSRLVPIASFYQGDYASDVIRDIESTQRYLISQRLVERADTISIQILTNKRQADKLTIKCAEENLPDFQIHDVNQILEKEKIEIPDQQDFSSGLFCYFASRKIAVNHYAQAEEKKYYYHHIAGMVLRAASMAFVAIGIGMATTSAAKGWIYNDTVTETELLEQKYKSKFNQLSETMIDSTTSTSEMRNIVQTVQTIQNKFINEPEEMLTLISQNVSLFPNIRISRIEWFTSGISDAESADEVNWSGASKRRQKKKKSSQQKPAKKGYFEIANVEGAFLQFDGDYRYALSTVDDLETAMVESGNYFTVEITKRPLNIESDNSLAGDASLRIKTTKPVAQLGFRVVREVTSNE